MRFPHQLAAIVVSLMLVHALKAADFDLVIYGGTASGVIAAVQAKKMGKSVIIVGPDKHLGGLSSGGLGYSIDSHNVQRYITPEGYVQNEGDIGVGITPYAIAYGSLVPKPGQCDNLFVSICVSSSHIAYGSIRMEPVFMILGQSAATAAALAIDGNLAVQDVPYAELRERLRKDGQVLEYASAEPGGKPVPAETNSSRYAGPYPAAASKKGLQVEMVDDALALGVKHAALNFNLAQLINPQGGTNSLTWEREGRQYHFQRGYVEGLDQRIKVLSDRGVVVTMIVLTYQSGDPDVNRILIHPRCETNAPNHLGNFNTVTDEGRRWLAATLEFCAERWSRPDQKYGRVSGYIMGNEVNSHWWWANMGRVSMEEFADDYLRTVRLAHAAIRKESSWARVYLSLEHHWNIRYAAGDEQQAFPARAFLDYFARRAREGGDFDWNIAFHPYPENLFEPRFWNDKTATTNVLTTPRITFKNIELLPAYLRRPELLFNGEPRRIILSEQGFHTPKGTNGETIQAAAYCYAYKKIEQLDGIDAFILHRHVDNAHEGGLLLGLRSNQPKDGELQPKKKIYDCFRAADTPEWKEAFEFALPVIGLGSWDELARPK